MQAGHGRERAFADRGVEARAGRSEEPALHRVEHASSGLALHDLGVAHLALGSSPPDDAAAGGEHVSAPIGATAEGQRDGEELIGPGDRDRRREGAS